MAEPNYEEIYKNWDALPDTRLRLSRENMWAKGLSNGTLAINSTPVDEKYRWQDVICRGQIVHRRWNTKIWYMYQGDKDEEVDLAIRKQLGGALDPIGHPGFFWVGRAYILMKSDDAEECRNKLVEALATLDIEHSVAPMWHINGEEPPEDEVKSD